MSRRAPLVTALLVVMCASVSRPARAAEPAPLVIYYADPGQDVRAVGQGLRGVARRRGTAFIDLSPTPEPAPKAALNLAHGVEAFYADDYDGARAHLDRAIDEISSSGARGLTVTELSDLFIFRALAYRQVGDTTRAWDDFVHAAVLDPTRRIDPARFPPRVVETFERATGAVLGGERTSLTVELQRSCSAWLDARPLAPVTALEIARGVHYLRFECPGREAYGAAVLADQPTQNIKPVLPLHAAPTDAEVARAARRRAAKTFVFVRALVPADGGPRTTVLRLINAADGSERARVIVSTERGATEIGNAADRMIEDVVAPAVTAINGTGKRQPTAWYDRPWLWGAAGAAITAAILLPFVLDSSSTTGFDVTPEGSLPP